MGSPFLASDAFAHAPSAISLDTITETQIKINWTHATTAACGTGCDQTGPSVDIIRTVQGGGATQFLNNQTGTAYTDFSLKQGTHYEYLICHGDSSTTDCTVSGENNSEVAEPVSGTTLATAPTGITLSANPTTIGITMPLGMAFNNSAVTGLKVEYSSDSGSSYTTATSNSTGIGGNATLSRTVPIYTIEGLSADTTYLVRLTAVTDSSESWGGSASNTAAVPLQIKTPAVVSTHKATPPSATVYSNGDIVDGNLKVTLKEDRGWDRILNVALYTNISADQGIENSDTYITWNFFDGVSVTDPHGYFNDVDVVGERSGVRTQDFTYEIAWDRPLGANDVIIETKDFQSNAGLTLIKDAWKSFPVKQVSYEVPEETIVETTAMLWNEGVMNHVFLNNDVNYALVSDMQYFIQDETIDVSQDEVVLEQEEGVIELFEDTTLSKTSMKIGSKYIKTLIVSGTVNTEVFDLGSAVTFNIIGPDGSESKINAVTTSDRTFEVPIVLEGLKSGTYQLVPVHDTHTGEALSFRH